MRHFDLSSSTALSECRSDKRIPIKEFRSASQNRKSVLKIMTNLMINKISVKNMNSLETLSDRFVSLERYIK